MGVRNRCDKLRVILKDLLYDYNSWLVEVI